ncbi:hypothetical protein J2W34_005227 [Variovorax boronicumulans]|nr:hypothetical protein [Variovorax boronicumulans]
MFEAMGGTNCQALIQALVPDQVIYRGIPTAGLLAQVMVAKYSDHLPLYLQETIFGRAGLAIPRSTLGAWVGACGVRLQPLVDALKEAILAYRALHAETGYSTPLMGFPPKGGRLMKRPLSPIAGKRPVDPRGRFEDVDLSNESRRATPAVRGPGFQRRA